MFYHFDYMDLLIGQPLPIRILRSHVGKQKKNSILIKPTFGSFRNYSTQSLLHCGISDSNGLSLPNIEKLLNF